MSDVKRAVIDAMLCSECPTMITVDGRSCDVPDAFRDCAHLVLRIGTNLEPPVHISHDEHALIATLTFAGADYRCTIPWDALYAAMFEGDPKTTLVFPSQLPRQGVAPADPPKKRGFLRSVS